MDISKQYKGGPFGSQGVKPLREEGGASAFPLNQLLLIYVFSQIGLVHRLCFRFAKKTMNEVISKTFEFSLNKIHFRIILIVFSQVQQCTLSIKKTIKKTDGKIICKKLFEKIT